MRINWINGCQRWGLVCMVLVLCSCTSSLEKVTDESGPTMKELYDEYAGADNSDASLAERRRVLLERAPTESCDLQLGQPPYPEQLNHLYPRLPNPDIYLYVRPHAVGTTGAPVPAYITRFPLYERQPYALPGESLETLPDAAHERSTRCRSLTPHPTPAPVVDGGN